MVISLAKRLLRVIKGEGHGFGTSAVFLTSICTILGAIMFLRFGYAVGHLGLLGALAIIILGHLITIPTGLAVSEIATNLKVGGGGAYYIISRSFGTTIGSSIGMMLYASQVISVAFYLIAFAEIFKFEFFSQFVELIETYTNITFDTRMISLPVGLLLFSLIIKRGANIGMKALWFIFGILIMAVALFLLGSPISGGGSGDIYGTTKNPESFAVVFAIVFPAFTGIIAGVGLSGDLKDPRKSIPQGVIIATFMGLIIYILIVFKLFFSAPFDDLANNQNIMYDISIWGPIILLGLVAATLSSAVGSILVAPRTMQAMANDNIFQNDKINSSLAKGHGKENEPTNATLISTIIAIGFIILGDLNVVASIITMFFLITYGTICLISFLEHFAGNPSYRPTFKTKWYLSFMGMVLSFAMMFQINLMYAVLAIIIMVIIYESQVYTHKEARSFAVIFQGVMFQLSSRMKLALQKSGSKPDKYNWRPSVLAVSSSAVERAALKNLMKWISYHYGFGTMMNLIKSDVDRKNIREAKRKQKELVEQINISKANYSVTTIVSPSLQEAITPVVQYPDISGLDNNTILFEFHRNRTEELDEIVECCKLIYPMRLNISVLRATEHNFGNKKKIHIWLTKIDYRNANMMILLSFIIMAHPDWNNAKIKIFTAFSKDKQTEQISNIKRLIAKGRLPISLQNIQSYTFTDKKSLDRLIYRKSKDADLVIIGFTRRVLMEQGVEIFKQHSDLREILFVNAEESIHIS
jgi:amino acid transporter